MPSRPLPVIRRATQEDPVELGRRGDPPAVVLRQPGAVEHDDVIRRRVVEFDPDRCHPGSGLEPVGTGPALIVSTQPAQKLSDSPARESGWTG